MNITPEDWSILSKLFDDALDRPPADRERWLESLPQEQATFRDTLRTMLATHAKVETNDFLKTLPKFDTPKLSVELREPALKAGATVGPYLLEAEIGRGGMGAVWRAHRTDGVLKRSVALKLPHAGPFSSQIAQRFVLERDILAELTHPNIARLYDAGTTESGQSYLALEFVEGVPLTDYCDLHRLDIEQRLQLVLQMLEAVRYAHSRLVIHRDLKPSNILVTPDGQLRLLDFGIAKLLSSNTAHAAMTEVGARVLTPDYAAPELISGGAITTATDVYSAGVVLYELLTGERPYRLQRNSLGALEDAIVNGDPIRASQAAISDASSSKRNSTTGKLKRQLAGDLDTIVLKVLKKRPEDRYATVDALREDIERYLLDRPVLARPDSRWYVAKKFVARHRIPVSIGIAAFSAVTIAAAVALFEARRATSELEKTLQLSGRNEAVSEFLNTVITEAAQSEKPVTVTDMLARSEKLAELQYAGSPENRAAVLDMLGEYYYTTGDNPRANSLFKKASDASRDSPDWDLRARITCHLFAPAQQARANSAGVAALRAVIDDPRTQDPQAAQCLMALANIARDSNEFANALSYDTEALRRLRQMTRPADALEASVLGELATAEHLNGHSDLAEQYFASSLKKYAASGHDRSANAIAIRNNWAVMSSGTGDPKRALDLYDQTVQIVTTNDPEAPIPNYLIGNRANSLYLIGRYDESIGAYKLCIQQSVGLGQANCLLGIASVYRDLGDVAMARDFLTKAAAVIEAKAPPGSGMSFALAIVRGKLALSERHFGDARTALATVIDRVKTTAHAVGALTVRAEVNLEDDQLAAAEADARAALSLSEKLQGGKPYSNRTGLAWFVLARTLEKQGNTIEASKAVQSAVLHLTNTVDSNHPALIGAKKLSESLAHESKAES